MEDEIKKELLEGEQTEEQVQQEEPTIPAADDTSSPDEPVSEQIESNEPVPPAAEAEEVTETPFVEENGAVDTSIKTFTQDDVDKLVGDTRVRTREKTFRYIYDRYGVKNEEELDALMANAQRYDTQKEMYEADKASWSQERDENSKKLSDMSEQIALMQSEIDPARYEDAKLILRGKGMEVTLENIQSEMETHPEWKKEEPKAPEMPEAQPEAPKPTMRIKALGNEQKPVPEVSEEEQAQKLFKMKW